MTFYYQPGENNLEGNRLGEYVDVDGEEVTIDVDGIMEHDRGLGKLREMQSAIGEAIEANKEENDG